MLQYQKYFRGCSRKAFRLEASPGYLFRADDIAQTMRTFLPKETKLIFLLREPISRLLSLFSARSTKGKGIKSELTFDEYVSICLGDGDILRINADLEVARRMALRIHEGVYAPKISTFMKHWPKEQMCLLFFDDLRASPRTVAVRASDFLGLKTAHYDNYDFQVENKTQSPKFPALHRIVHGLNRRYESQLNRFPVIRRSIRTAYNSVATGGSQSPIQLSDRTRLLLADFYRGPNSDLRILCQEHFGIDTPDWQSSS